MEAPESYAGLAEVELDLGDRASVHAAEHLTDRPGRADYWMWRATMHASRAAAYATLAAVAIELRNNR